MIKKIALAALAFLSVKLFSQTLEYAKYDWDALPKPTVLSDQEKKENTIILKDKRIIEYAYNQKGELNLYMTRHRKIKVNSDKAIEENNKIYIPMGNVNEMLDLKARTINKDGKISLLDEKNVKDVPDLQGAGPYKIFAMEGVENGSEIEYIYTILKKPSMFGTEILQSDEERKDVELAIYSPDNLVVEAKAYNLFPEFRSDTTISVKHKVYSGAERIAAYKAEKYSTTQANLMRAEYKLAYNLSRGNKRIYTWEEAGDRYYSTLTEGASKVKRKVSKLLKPLKLADLSSEEEKIRAVEDMVKRTFIKKDEPGDDFSSLEKILKNHYGNSTGLVKLFMALYDAAKIRWQLVVTSDRQNQKFDGGFDTWNFLDNFLLYFPGADNFIAPSEPFTRYGFVPAWWTNNQGLFIAPITLGKLKTATSKIGTIPAVDYTKSSDDMYLDMKFADDLGSLNFHFRRVLNGYDAEGIQPLYAFLQEEDRKGVQDGYLKVFGNDAKISNVKVENFDETSIMRKPFTFEADESVSSLIEKAGEKFLVKIGESIGPQVELYQEDVRKTDVENEFNRSYHREIVLEIPQGYKIANLEALNMDVYCGKPDQRTAEFRSSYTLEGNKVKVAISENYRQIVFPKEEFNDFRKVINAAADFNKIVLYMEKK